LLSASVSGVLTTGVLTVDANSNVNGSAGAKSAAADATVNNLVVSLLNLLNATTVQSTASISGDAGALVRTGTTTIVGLSLFGGPVLNLTPSANDVVFNAGGIKITLNEETPSGNGISDADLSVNAIDISFTNAPFQFGNLLDLVNGNIIISHSEADLVATGSPPASVPEPSSLLLLASGFAAMFGVRRKFLSRNRAA
jgi:hypothetical protein